MEMLTGTWNNVDTVRSARYTCGHCGNSIASEKAFFTKTTGGNPVTCIYICHICNRPSLLESGRQIPGAKFGEDIRALPNDIAGLYEEARNCASANAYTAAVLCCRKLLMNIAVSKGALPNLSFIAYVEYLSNAGYVPPDGKNWVDHIRTKGNEATHEISIMNKADAYDLITFIGMLLKFIFEFPSKIKSRTSSA